LFLLCGLFAFPVAVYLLSHVYEWGVENLDKLGERRRRRLPDLVATVGSITGLLNDHVAGSHASLFGALASGRAARVQFGRDARRIDLRVDTQGARDLLTVTKKTLVTRVGEALGVKEKTRVGAAGFDGRFLIESADPDDARRFFKQAWLRLAVERVFELGASELRFVNGGIEATAPGRALEPSRYRKMLDALEDVARALERKRVSVRVLGGERHAFVDDSGKTRCPYCHGGLTGDEPDLVACEKCTTVLHAGCWEEHGGCPLLGCTGRRPERAAVK
jgi:hypothetical protein